MSETLKKAGVCPSCGAPLKALTNGPTPSVHDPAAAISVERTLYDIEAMAAEAAREKAYDESARIRVTQEDIRHLLEKRKRARPK